MNDDLFALLESQDRCQHQGFQAICPILLNTHVMHLWCEVNSCLISLVHCRYVLKSQMKELLELEAKNAVSIEEEIENERKKVDAKTPITEEVSSLQPAMQCNAMHRIKRMHTSPV